MVYFAFSLDPVHCSTKLSIWARAALYFSKLYMTPLQKTQTIPLTLYLQTMLLEVIPTEDGCRFFKLALIADSDFYF